MRGPAIGGIPAPIHVWCFQTQLLTHARSHADIIPDAPLLTFARVSIIQARGSVGSALKALTVVLILCAKRALGQGYAATCQNIEYFPEAGLEADCRNDGGNFVFTSLDLDLCVANYDGNLACAHNGAFSASCSGCELSGTVLSCTCGNGSGGSSFPTLDLNTCIANQNGFVLLEVIFAGLRRLFHDLSTAYLLPQRS
ncbi:hypothetical protein A0H81_10615 [Grifola frondosa]|uniref:Cyanovirin-N domain-containing protein n=1 Tax=Grifola frondosa TaxID=5627 RepID=A0A1C7LXG2_GRIFR|nr:hypothetical protein A0H81_10615 [Grifola frondosa]